MRSNRRYASGRGCAKPEGDDWLEGSGIAIAMLDCVPPTEQRSGSEIDAARGRTLSLHRRLDRNRQRLRHRAAASGRAGLGLLDRSRFDFINADTDKTPYDSGTFASVGMMVPTKAVENAAVALRER